MNVFVDDLVCLLSHPELAKQRLQHFRVLASQREENANAPKLRGRSKEHMKKSVTRETLRWLGSPKFGIPSSMMEHLLKHFFFGNNRKKTKANYLNCLLVSKGMKGQQEENNKRGQNKGYRVHSLSNK